MEHIIEIRNLCKSFGDIKAVNDLTFSVKAGEFFAFLGENGAGKSTTISIMCGRLKKDFGEVLVCGKTIEDNKELIAKNLGVVFQNSVLDPSLTVKENLESRASLYGFDKKEFNHRLLELSKLLDFEDLINRNLGKLSGGQKRRIDIARALFHKPKLLILDEPTTGLDPQTRKLLWNVINDLRKKEGLTVFLTTHYMEEASEADYIVILDKGKIAAKGSPFELKNKYAKDYLIIYNLEAEKVKSLNKPYEVINSGYKITVDNISEITKMIVEHPSIFVNYEVTKGKMDDVFLNVTGKKISGGNN